MTTRNKLIITNTFHKDIIENRAKLADSMKILLYEEDNAIFDKLDFDNDDIFLEPLLFNYFNTNNEKRKYSIEQILCSYFPKDDEISLYFNETGKSYIPNIGYTKFDRKNGYIKASIRNTEVTPILKIPNSNLHLYRHNILPYLDFYNIDNDRGEIVENVKVEVQNTAIKHKKHVFKACEILDNHLPDLFDEINLTNKGIMTFNNPKVFCFVTMQAHGDIFLSCIPENDEVFFVEELIHQCSHNTFNLLLYDKESLFKVDIEKEILGNHINRVNEKRTIYSAIHGLYTVAKRYEAFYFLYHMNIFEGQQKHEFLGRIADLRKRFRTGLELLPFSSIFTDKGMHLYETIDKNCFEYTLKLSHLDNIFDLSNQPQEFSYALFEELNPFVKFEKELSKYPLT